MKIPNRKLPILVEATRGTTPPEDSSALVEMGLSPATKAPISVAQVENKTPSEARVDSVNALLSSAYARASQLRLTAEEVKALTADFPDKDFYRGAAGNADLIYLQHSAIRQRLNDVIGIGQWSLIIRRNWTEEFLTAKKEQAARVYVEAVMMIRGCYVGEAIGDMVYYKSNAGQNFGDAYEGAKSAALRRCAKDFGIGLQPWNKDFCEAWKAKYKNFNRPT